jgi:hypothetical protein
MRVAITGQLGIDARPSAAGRVPRFEDEQAGALAEDEAVARGVEGAAGSLGRLVVRRQGTEQTEARQADRVDHRVEAPGEDIVGGAAPDQLHGDPDGLTPGGAGRVDRGGVAADPEATEQEGQPGAGLAAEEGQGIHREAIGQQSIRAEVAVGSAVAVHLPELADPQARLAASHHASPARRVAGLRPDPGIAQSLLGRGEAQDVGAVGELEELPVVDRAAGVELFHLGGDAHRKAAGVEMSDRRHTALARQEGVPRRGDVVPERGHEAQAGDGDPARSPRHSGPHDTISIRPVATRFPSTIAARLSSAAPSVADRIAVSISTA